MTTITADTVVVGVDPYDLSEERFRAVLTDAGSPAASESHAAYMVLGTQPVSIAFALAVFAHESGFATNPAAIVVTHGTLNPGNCRSSRIGPLPIVQTARGPFVRYPTWAEGWRDLAWRLVDPTYVYAKEGRRTIRQVIERFAPATDGNAPDTYVNAVVADMTRWQEDVSVEVDISGFVPPRVVQQWFAPNGISYLGEPMEMWGVCIHQTGNTSPSAEAQANVNYMRSDACIQRQASWHATVGLDTIIETIPDDRQAYHGSDGDGPGNTHFFAIEGVMCYPPDSPELAQVMRNHAWYAATKLHAKGLPLVPIVQDADWSRGVTLAQHNSFARDNKDCPQWYRDGRWETFAAYVRAFMAALDAPPASITFPETGQTLSGGFRRFWEARGGVSIFGYPITGEQDEDGVTVQWFERARFEWRPDTGKPEDWHVVLGRLGAEVLVMREVVADLREQVAAWTGE